MRGRFFHRPAIGRALACLAMAALIAAVACYAARQPSVAGPLARASAVSGDGLSAAMARCQTLGEAAGSDPACLAAWAENRRRFFTDRPAAGPATAAKDR